MIDLLTFCLTTSFATIGIHGAICWQGMIFNEAKIYLDAYVPQSLQKPLYSCIICMGSIWSILGYLLLWVIHQTPFHLVLLPVAIFFVAGFNAVLSLVMAYLKGNQ